MINCSDINKMEKIKKLNIKTKELLIYWKEMEKARRDFSRKIDFIEKKMQKKFKDNDISFFFVDGEIVGIGTYPNFKKMNLINDTNFDKLKKRPLKET